MNLCTYTFAYIFTKHLSYRTALHLAASNGEASALDYMLRHLSEPININPLDRLGGTPTEDAYRHDQMVAVAMLEDAGGLRQGNPDLLAMEAKVHADMENIQRKERSGKVADLVQGSPESKACVWVRGRCGKLLPGQLTELRHLSKDLLDELMLMNAGLETFQQACVPTDPSVSVEKALRNALKSPQYYSIIVSSCV